MTHRSIRPLVGLTLLLGMPALSWARAHEDPNARYRVDIRGRPWTGARHAKVTIAVWGEFQCPWTAHTFTMLRSVLRKYPRSVKIVWFDFPPPIHQMSMPASVAAHEVFRQRGNAAFWRFAQHIFTNQAELLRGTQASERLFAAAARKAGINPKSVINAASSLTHQPKVQAVYRAGSKIGIRGTPTLFVNGRKLRGWKPLPVVERLVKEEIQQANKILRLGRVRLPGYYAHIQRRAVVPPPTRRRRQLDPNAVYRVPVTGRSPWKGARWPLVTMVVWMDFQCPYSKYANCLVRLLLKAFPRALKIVFRNNPLSYHRQALPAAEAALEAYRQKQNRGFWAMHDRLFPTASCPTRPPMPHTRDWLLSLPRSTHLFQPNLLHNARLIGLDTRRFQRALTSRIHKKRIQREQALAIQLGARGTPGFFVNGRYVRGIRSLAEYKKIIQAEIRKARQLMRGRRIPRRRLYQTIIAKGATAPVYLPDRGPQP